MAAYTAGRFPQEEYYLSMGFLVVPGASHGSPSLAAHNPPRCIEQQPLAIIYGSVHKTATTVNSLWIRTEDKDNIIH